MFIPDEHLPVPHIVAWIAGLGEQGKLDRRLGFVHPGEAADALDLPAEATARFVLGGKLACGALTACAVLDQSGKLVFVPAHYWSSSGAAKTMVDGWLDFGALGLEDNIALVILSINDVAAALGFRFASADDPDGRTPVRLDGDEARAVPEAPAPRGALSEPWKRGRSYRAADEPLIREMHDLITSGRASNPRDAARAVVGKAEGKGEPQSKVERLANRYRSENPPLEPE